MSQQGIPRGYGQPVLMVRAPGRFNLIGEHTDYNQGLVMPAAIDRAMTLYFGHQANSPELRAFSYDYGEIIMDDDSTHLTGWRQYLWGVRQVLLDAGIPVAGIDITVTSHIPSGAGLSSSAALCCGLVTGISRLNGVFIPEREIALMAQAAEHLAGVPCGLMDQYAVMFGKKDRLLALDCSTMNIEYLPLTLNENRLWLVDSGVRHELAAGQAYNERRQSCERVVRIISDKEPMPISSLRAISPALLHTYAEVLDPVDYQRALYVLEENERVRRAGEALQTGDLASLGHLLSETHEGLRHQYAVTVGETDWLVDYLRGLPEVWGARQLGAGFGGCVLVLAKGELPQTLPADYLTATGHEARVYPIWPEDGLSVRVL
jgi:galactokinase